MWPVQCVKIHTHLVTCNFTEISILPWRARAWCWSPDCLCENIEILVKLTLLSVCICCAVPSCGTWTYCTSPGNLAVSFFLLSFLQPVHSGILSFNMRSPPLGHMHPYHTSQSWFLLCTQNKVFINPCHLTALPSRLVIHLPGLHPSSQTCPSFVRPDIQWAETKQSLIGKKGTQFLIQLLLFVWEIDYTHHPLLFSQASRSTSVKRGHELLTL